MKMRQLPAQDMISWAESGSGRAAVMGTQAQTGLPELCSPCGAPLPPDPTATSPTASVPASGI